jgi:hypothetical protein
VYIGRAGFDIGSLVYAGGSVVVGLQAVLFGYLAKYYGARAGFLPVTDREEKFFVMLSMERIIAAGVFIFALSFLGGVYGISVWMSVDFGDLIPREIISITVPSAVGSICGSELVMFGLFLGVLDVQHK